MKEDERIRMIDVSLVSGYESTGGSDECRYD